MDTPNAADVDRREIRRVTAELLAAVNASDVDRCAALWTPDGVLMPPHHPRVHGHEAIVEYFRELFARSRFSFTFTSSEIDLMGDTAMERVTYTVTAWTGRGSPPVEDAGKGIHVYQRQPDGSWKLSCDIWNSDRPVAS
jgi:uncharacterized protein (TIGR02246 family)